MFINLTWIQSVVLIFLLSKCIFNNSKFLKKGLQKNYKFQNCRALFVLIIIFQNLIKSINIEIRIICKRIIWKKEMYILNFLKQII